MSYQIVSRIAGRNAPWADEGSGDVYDTREEAEATIERLEGENDDGEALEYDVREMA